MKKLILLCCAFLAITSQVNAQTTLANAGLENWVDVFGATTYCEEPSGWLTPNLLTSSFVVSGNTNPVCVTKVSGAGEVTEGTYAMKITTVDIQQNPQPDYIPDRGGVAFIGTPEIIGSDAILHIGFPVSNFAPVSFAYDRKYTPVNVDSAFANVVLTHYNTSTNKRDTIAYTSDTVKVGLAAYDNELITLNYLPGFVGVNADTCMIGFSSSSRYLPQTGSVFYVDNLSFSFTAGTKVGLEEDGFMIYPNPNNDRLFISGITGNNAASRIDVYNAEGILSLSQEINSATASVPTSNLESGIYHLQILNKNGQVISRKKFSVIK